MSPQADNL